MGPLPAAVEATTDCPTSGTVRTADELLGGSSSGRAGCRARLPRSRRWEGFELSLDIITRLRRLHQRDRRPGSRVLAHDERTSPTGPDARSDGRHHDHRAAIRATPANRDLVPQPRRPHLDQRPAGPAGLVRERRCAPRLCVPSQGDRSGGHPGACPSHHRSGRTPTGAVWTPRQDRTRGRARRLGRSQPAHRGGTAGARRSAVALEPPAGFGTGATSVSGRLRGEGQTPAGCPRASVECH
jgi:hypothetical protein